MTLADRAQYGVAIREPLIGRYRGWTLATMPPPSAGGLTILQMLGMLERFPLGDAAQGYGFGSPQTLHVMIEAMRLAFADRVMWMGDDDAVAVPGAGLLHPQYLAARAALIKADRRMDTPAAGYPLVWDPAAAAKLPKPSPLRQESPQTTHFSVIGRWPAV